MLASTTSRPSAAPKSEQRLDHLQALSSSLGTVSGTVATRHVKALIPFLPVQVIVTTTETDAVICLVAASTAFTVKV